MKLNLQAGPCIISGLLVFAGVMNILAQERVPPPIPQENAAVAATPDSRMEWAVEVRTSGGFDGQGNGGFAVTSDGRVTCISSAPCTRQIPKPALQSLEGWVHSASLPLAIRIPGLTPPFPVPTNPSVCSDCIITTMFLRIRDSRGIDWNYSVSWDLTTLASVPADFRQIFQAAAAIAK